MTCRHVIPFPRDIAFAHSPRHIATHSASKKTPNSGEWPLLSSECYPGTMRDVKKISFENKQQLFDCFFHLIYADISSCWPAVLCYPLAPLCYFCHLFPPNFVPHFTFAFVRPRITTHSIFSYSMSKQPVSWSVYFISVSTTRSLALALSLSPPPFSILGCFCTCPKCSAATVDSSKCHSADPYARS